MGKLEELIAHLKEQNRKRNNPTHQDKINALVRDTQDNMDSPIIQKQIEKRAKAYGKSRKEAREAKQKEKNNNRFKKIERNLASKDNK